MDSNSSEQSSVSDYSTDSSDEDGMETAQINDTKLQLPQGLCEKKEVFKEFFSVNLWNSLPEKHKLHLRTFLPNFPENDEVEKSITLQKLFNFESFRFHSPVEKFHDHLRAGYFRPDIAKMRQMIRKAEYKEAKYRYKTYKEKLKNEVVESQKRLLSQVRNLPPGIEPKTDRISDINLDVVKHRTKRRYFQILASVRSKTEDSSSDENYLEGSSNLLSRKQKRHLNSIKNSLVNSSDKLFVSTLETKNAVDLERYLTNNANPFYVSDDSYRNMLYQHKRRKLDCPDEAEFHTKGITLNDIVHRTQLPYLKNLPVPVKHHSDNKVIKKKTSSSFVNISHANHLSSNSENESDSDSMSSSVKPKLSKPSKPPPKAVAAVKIKTEVKSEPEEVLNVKPINNISQYGKITPVTLSDLEGIDMMNIPIDLDNSDIDILELNNKPELMQETHSNFLSLIRDIVCSTTDHRMSFNALQTRLRAWQESPISPLNDWYSKSDNWTALLQSAIDFLCGNSLEQPEDFVPYMEYKVNLDLYQWIGAGRDTDQLLTPLCLFWLDHRAEPKIKVENDVEISDRSQTPPPPRCPTNWTIRKATPEEIDDFREQERRRYNNPHKAFTYWCNGYESVVGPLKGIYHPSVGNTKARGHTMLTADRPNFVTILSLVRDATARLPNGEGTRADICELLKCSQYISSNAPDNVLQSVVSGALDRMHTQFDPCVKYDPKRKIWIYLHRNRTEEDFEKIHQQYQTMNKTSKKTSRKTPTKPKVKVDKISKPTKEPPSPMSEKMKVIKKTLNNLPQSAIGNNPKQTSLLLSNNLQTDDKSNSDTSVNVTTDENEINEALQSIVETRDASPKPTKPTKSVVKILSPVPSRSLISSPEKQEASNSSQEPSQLVQITQKPNIQLLQKSKDPDKPESIKRQIVQNITPQQLQNIKNVTLLRNVPQSQATSQPSELYTMSVTVAKTITQDHLVQSGIQIKTQATLTPAQQQQILQSLKQKMVPQSAILSPQQQQLLVKKAAIQSGQKQSISGSGYSLLGQTKTGGEGTISKSSLVSSQAPVVAKVLTNAAGQVISVESLLEHQKQHGSLPQGTTLRIPATKGGQPNIIQLTGASKQNTLTQFAVASQNNLIALTNQPKLVSTSQTAMTTMSTLVKPRAAVKTQTITKFPSKVTQQLINAKIIQSVDGHKIVQPKIIMGQNQVKLASGKNVTVQKPTSLTVAGNSNAIRMVNAANLNLAHIGGKPVLLASKGGTIQNLQGQNVILQQATPSSSGTSLVLQSGGKSATTANVGQTSSSNINLVNQQNVVLAPQVKVQQPQVVLSSNIKSTTSQSTQGQIVLGGHPVRLQTSSAANTQRLVLASQGQGGQILAQQIFLPAGFQGTTINIKALQGVKVIPLAQAQGQSRGTPNRQVFARLVNPTIVKTQQQSAVVSESSETTPSSEDV